MKDRDDMNDQDMEFVPGDDPADAEPAEEQALHVTDLDEEAAAVTPGAEEEPLEPEGTEGDAEREEREEDLTDILRRQYGLGEAPVTEGRGGPEESEEAEDAEETFIPRPARVGEFQCSGCFMLKPASQLADAGHRICVDCATDGYPTKAAS